MSDTDDDDELEAGFYSEQIAKRKKVRSECMKKGLHWARSCVGNRSDGEVAQYMAEWIDEVEKREEAERAGREFLLSERGVIAAERSAISAAESAVSASGSTRAALASAAFAFIALIVSIAAYFKT